jgi:hypothetical protein
MPTLEDLREVLRDREVHAGDATFVRQQLAEATATRRPGRTWRSVAAPAGAAAAVVVLTATAAIVASGKSHDTAPGHRPSTLSQPVNSDHTTCWPGPPCGPAPSVWPTEVAPGPAVGGGADVTTPTKAVSLDSKLIVEQSYRILTADTYADHEEGLLSIPGQPAARGWYWIGRRGAFDPSRITHGEPVTVHGKAGRFGMLDGQPVLAWPYADDSWVVVQYQQDPEHVSPASTPPGGGPDQAAAREPDLAIANAIQIGPAGELPVAFTLGWLPAHLVDSFGGLTTGSESLLGFSDGHPGTDPGSRRGSAITVYRFGNRILNAIGTPIVVHGHHGYVTDYGLQLDLGDGSQFRIDVDEQHRNTISQDDLIKIAQHATFTPKLTDQSTWIPAGQALPR